MLEAIKRLLARTHGKVPEPVPEEDAPPPEPQSDWETFRGIYKGMSTVLRIDRNARECHGEGRCWYICISINYQQLGYPDFPPQGICDQLDDLEKAMTDYFKERQDGVMVATAADKFKRNLYFYCSGQQEFADDCENERFVPVEEFETQAVIEEDPDWALFEQLNQDAEKLTGFC